MMIMSFFMTNELEAASLDQLWYQLNQKSNVCTYDL